MASEPTKQETQPLRLICDAESSNDQRIDTREIFRRLILDEIRRGALDRPRRRRIIQYAAQLKLSAVEIGQLINSCRDELLAGEDHEGRHMAVRLLQDEDDQVVHPEGWHLLAMFTLRGLTIGLWIIAGILLLAWLFRS